MNKLLASLGIGVLCSTVLGQPTRVLPDGSTEMFVPFCVVIDADGKASVEAHWETVPAGSSVTTARPSSITIETVGPDGNRTTGVLASNRGATVVDFVEYTQPTGVVLSDDGTYLALSERYTLWNTSSRFAPGWAHKFEMPLTCRVRYGGEPSGNLPRPRAGFTVSFAFPDDAVGVAAFGSQARYDKVKEAVRRGVGYLERNMANSTGSLIFSVVFGPINNPTSDAEMTTSIQSAPTTTVKARVLQAILRDDEPQYETDLYSIMPGAIPYIWDATNRSASQILLAVPQAIHLQGIYGSGGGIPTQPPTTHGILTIRPEFGVGALPNLKWQVYKGPCGATSTPGSNRAVLDAVVVHEVMHGIGFASVGDLSFEPTSSITLWDAFRFPEAIANANQNNFPTTIRELRPAQQAVGITGFFSPQQSKMLSKGNRLGGDGNSSGHWKSKSLLGTGAAAIGVMDPATEAFACENPKNPRFFGAADLRALDTAGWNIDPLTANYTFPTYAINTVTPANSQVIASGTTPTFSWIDSGAPYSWSVHVFGGPAPDEDAAFVYEAEGLLTTSHTPAVAFPVGVYSFYYGSEYDDGFIFSDTYTFIVTCPADFNQNGGLDPQDIFDFLNAWFAGCPTSPPDPCPADFNASGVLEPADIFDFLNAWFAGC